MTGHGRMFTSSLNEEVKALEEDIEAVKDKVEDGMISEKVRQYVYAPREIQDVYKADAGTPPPSVRPPPVADVDVLHFPFNPCLSRLGCAIRVSSPISPRQRPRPRRRPPRQRGSRPVTRTDAPHRQGPPRPRRVHALPRLAR